MGKEKSERKSERGDPVKRVLVILQYISGIRIPVTVTDVHKWLSSEGFECHRRTVLRDLEMLAKSNLIAAKRTEKVLKYARGCFRMEFEGVHWNGFNNG